MKSEWMITLLTAGGILILCAAMIIWDKIRQRKWFLRHLKQRWGTIPDREYTQEELESISHYARRHEGEPFMIDDITWNDLQMDEIFIRMNNTLSSCGEDVLYQMLRQSQMHREVLEERERLIAYFQTHEEERIQVLTRVKEVKKIWKMSIADYIDALKDVDRTGRAKYPMLAGLSVAAIIATLIKPIPCMFLLLLMLCVSAVVHTRDSKKIEPYLNCFVCILRLLRAADQFEKLDNPVIQTYLDRIREGRKKMKSFRRGAFLVASTNSVQDGLEAIVVSYLRIIFQVDFIKFYSMLKHVEGNEAIIEDMYQAIGELDALIAVASFRESLPYYSLPEFTETDNAEGASLEVEELYHPLIADPVVNGIRMQRGVLITGSNASGKSTFLKTIAINTILAQTVHTCIAKQHRGSFLKVLTSMALRDNLAGGESYYMVEIRSLKRILEECERPEPVLCIVDEVLRGTNTIERIAASSQILHSLAKPKVLAMAATHDIELSYILEKEYDNYHFEEEIQEKDVVFDYKLRTGRAMTRNAIRLLAMIGYDPKIIEAAQESAKQFEETGVWK